MNARNRGIGIGFVSGLAVAIACRSTSSSVVDAQAADSLAADVAADVATADAPGPGTTVPDRLRVRTADSDVDQLDDGSASLPGRSGLPVLVAAGPLVITDVWHSSASLSLYVSSTDDCRTTVVRPQIGLRHLNSVIHNVRVAVKPGEFLCATSVSDSFDSFEWSGYRAYQPN